MPLFGKIQVVEQQVDDFLDAVLQGALVFRDGIDDYLAGRGRDFAAKLQQIDELETRADEISREVEAFLYSRSLIPEHRGDVLGLLEHTDDIIDCAKACLYHFDVERPEVPAPFGDEFRRLASVAHQAVEAVVNATRRFFRDPAAVADHLTKVDYFEGEADRIGLELKRAVFATDLELARKLQLRYFTEAVDRVADTADNVAGRLGIYAIKRQI